MRTFVISTAVNVLGAIGRRVGNSIGIGTALVLSTVCSLAGVWVGWRIYEAYLS